MSVVREVLAELWSMFVGDRRLALLVLAVVVAAALAGSLLRGHAYIAPTLLLVGALGVLADSVRLAAKRSAGR